MPLHTAMAVPDTPAWLAIRPERISIGSATAPNCIAGVVTQRLYAGETLTHLVRLSDGTLLRTTAALRDGLGTQQIEVGETVTLSWQPDACILLAQ